VQLNAVNRPVIIHKGVFQRHAQRQHVHVVQHVAVVGSLERVNELFQDAGAEGFDNVVVSILTSFVLDVLQEFTALAVPFTQVFLHSVNCAVEIGLVETLTQSAQPVNKIITRPWQDIITRVSIFKVRVVKQDLP